MVGSGPVGADVGSGVVVFVVGAGPVGDAVGSGVGVCGVAFGRVDVGWTVGDSVVGSIEGGTDGAFSADTIDGITVVVSVERPIEGASVTDFADDSSLGASEPLSFPCVGQLVLGTGVFVGVGGRVLCSKVGV